MVADDYGRSTEPQTGAAVRDLVELVSPPSGGRLLDVGTGTGIVLEAARDWLGDAGTAVGVDLSIRMLQVGRARRPAIRVAAADAVDLPFRGDAFDVVTANFVIMHFPKYETALYDMLRVLKTGGRLATSTWGPGEDEFSTTWRELVDAAVGHELLDDAYRQVMPWRARFSDKAALEETFRDAGLHPVRVEPREYRIVLSREDYLESRATSVAGRFVRDMLGDDGWNAFMRNARTVFADRFPSQINDFRDVLLAVGTKAGGGLGPQDSQGAGRG